MNRSEVENILGEPVALTDYDIGDAAYFLPRSGDPARVDIGYENDIAWVIIARSGSWLNTQSGRVFVGQTREEVLNFLGSSSKIYDDVILHQGQSAIFLDEKGQVDSIELYRDGFLLDGQV